MTMRKRKHCFVFYGNSGHYGNQCLTLGIIYLRDDYGCFSFHWGNELVKTCRDTYGVVVWSRMGIGAGYHKGNTAGPKRAIFFDGSLRYLIKL